MLWLRFRGLRNSRDARTDVLGWMGVEGCMEVCSVVLLRAEFASLKKLVLRTR